MKVDFSDTETAFARKSDAELAHTRRLFAFMNKPVFVKVGSALGQFAVKYKLPFAERVTLGTIYKQFVGGRTLLEVEEVTKELAALNVLSILDYGAEGKESEQAYNQTMSECIRALEFSAHYASIPVVTIKVTGLTSNDLLESLSAGQVLNREEESQLEALRKRMDSLCHVAAERGVQLYVDAEESWLQRAIDDLVMVNMLRYNRGRAIVVNTYQMYRHDRLATLRDHHAVCREAGVLLGAKLVRGAYMNKENARAEAMGYESPIHRSKEASDADFDRAVDYCLTNLDTIEFVNASHNPASAHAMIEGMDRRGIPKDHPHQMFCQLYGMSDNLTFNLASVGYRVGKYLPYGPVADVVPYLVRRAQENTSITGEASRELSQIEQEIARRTQATA